MKNTNNNNNTNNNVNNQTPQEILKRLITTNSKASRRIIEGMTDETWQEVFKYMKSINKPSKKKKLKRNATTPIVMTRRWTLTDSTGVVDTLDESYVRYINDVLSQIRKKQTDYCYYIYQIIDLLKFEPELKVKLVDGVFYCSL